jgi:hypothetical protein
MSPASVSDVPEGRRPYYPYRATYDIEVMLQPTDKRRSEKLEWTSHHVLLSVSVCSRVHATRILVDNISGTGPFMSVQHPNMFPQPVTLGTQETVALLLHITDVNRRRLMRTAYAFSDAWPYIVELQ